MLLIYNTIVEIGFFGGLALAAVYAVLSAGYYTYRYMKGDDHPDITDLTISDILTLINPFYYKHPMNSVITTMFFIGIIGGLALVWPVLIPVGILYYTVNKIREKNLHKKKMWATLQE
jgi:hypothetical protein